jgi:hypothetical protein
MTKKKFQPFADNTTSLSIGELTIENGTDKIALYGSIDLRRDQDGRMQAKALKAAVDAIVRAFDQDTALPDQSAPPEAPQPVKNPFE